jgi:ABC-2 type transport system permease protein
MIRNAFRLHRWGMIGYGLVALLDAYVNTSSYQQVAGSTPADRDAFGRSMAALAAQISYILPPPFRLDTLDGYAQWRALGPLSLVVLIWAIAAAAGAVRGDEDRQLVDYWLAARVSRVRLVVSRLAAFGLASVVVAAVAWLGYVLGAVRYESPNLGGAAGKALALWLLMLALFAICYLVAQLVSTTRGAQVAGAVVVIVLYLFDVAARTNHSFDWLSWLSPFKWYDATDSLAPGGHVDIAGVGLSVALVLVLGALSALAFQRRDVRAALFQRRPREEKVRDVAPSPLLGWPVARLLYRQRWVVVGWILINVVFAAYIVGSAHAIVDTLTSLPGLHDFLTRGAGGDPYRAFIAAYWFGFAQLLLAGFAIHLVSGWASDDGEGILTAVLSTPVHRWAVVAERAVAALIGTVLVVAAGTLATAAIAAAIGSPLDAATLFRASWVLIPFALTYAAVGAIFASYYPRAALGVLGIVAFIGYLDYELVPLLKWPNWVSYLSSQFLYGTPYFTEVYWTGLWIMIGTIVVGFGAAMLLMERREVGA